MLKLIKQGGKLEERKMNHIYSGAGDCGSDSCESCGDVGNNTTFRNVYVSWFATPIT